MQVERIFWGTLLWQAVPREPNAILVDGTEAAVPIGALPVSSVVSTTLPPTQSRPTGSQRLVQHALAAVAAGMGGEPGANIACA